ncbi:aspartate aminotransferase family protein [Streptomyces sp. NPDC060022]|uniref:aspartate aminotransferase family protein n=1 Tax=Streptomyces sp. NPDC060022 TaxID=3347039 RepID=UPI0036CF9C34
MSGMQTESTDHGPGTFPPLRLSRTFELAATAEKTDVTAAVADRILTRDRQIPGEYPVYGRRASGAYVEDVDGNRYLDFLLAYGTVILGHAHPAVTEAAVQQIREGSAVSMPHALQPELTRRLVECIPHAELALLLKTGSDATGAAVRLSRSFTGRDVVLRWGYNGWHDWCANRREGIPESVGATVDTFEFNDLDSAERAFRRHPGQVACVIVMPFEVDPPDPDFLPGLRRLSDRHGALLVLDELRTGFRLGLGGAQEHFGVRADLVTLGKAMGNGYAISAVTGRADVMRCLGDVHISSTYYANALPMAASLATIEELAGTDALRRVAAMGARLMDGLGRAVAEAGLEAEAAGVPQMPFLRFTSPDPARRELAKKVFFTSTIRQGVLFHPNHHWFVSAAMTEADIDLAIACGRRAAAATAAQLREA